MLLRSARCVGSDPSILLRKRDLTIGYGQKDDSPICFEIADKYDIDVGFLKIYLSTQPVDLSLLPQPSPLVSDNPGQRDTAIPKALWIEIIILIKQMRNDKVNI